MFGSGIRSGFAQVDCRRCGKTDAGLLLDQTIWNWQTHKMTYSNCLSDTTSWVAENQGPQRPKSKSEWLQSNWSIFDEGLSSFSNMQGTRTLSSGTASSVESWALANFMENSLAIKRTLAELIRNSDRQEHRRQLEEHIRLEEIDI
jgi:hypothetical protein